MATIFDTSVLAYWHNRPLIASEAIAQIEAFLRQLRATHEMFSELFLMTDTGYRRLLSDFSDLEAALVKNMDDPEFGYINDLPSNLSFSPDCRSWLGFNAGFADTSNERCRRFRLSVSCGQAIPFKPPATSPNYIVLVVSPEIESPDLLRGLLTETVQFWRPEEAVVTRAKVRKILDQPVGELTPGWLTYLADPEVARAVPSGFAHTPFADGVLIEAAERPGREDDAEYVQRLIRLRDALRAQGFLNKLGTLLTARS